jgi:hypothetical protein
MQEPGGYDFILYVGRLNLSQSLLQSLLKLWTGTVRLSSVSALIYEVALAAVLMVALAQHILKLVKNQSSDRRLPKRLSPS